MEVLRTPDQRFDDLPGYAIRSPLRRNPRSGRRASSGSTTWRKDRLQPSAFCSCTASPRGPTSTVT